MDAPTDYHPDDAETLRNIDGGVLALRIIVSLAFWLLIGLLVSTALIIKL